MPEKRVIVDFSLRLIKDFDLLADLPDSKLDTKVESIDITKIFFGIQPRKHNHILPWYDCSFLIEFNFTNEIPLMKTSSSPPSN